MTWDEYAMNIAETISKKSKDPWRKVGAVILREDNTIASVGYNGFPEGIKEDWDDREERRKYVIHAEQNALRYIKPGEGKTLCSTLLPCRDCLKTIAAYKIKRVLFKDIYSTDPIALDISHKMGISLIQFKPEPITSYWNHDTKPSTFIVKRGDTIIHKGTYQEGSKLL